MNQEKIKKFANSLERSEGPISFLGLFYRTEPLDKWDLLISASWLHRSEINHLRKVVSELKKEFSDDEMEEFGKVVILDGDDPTIAFLKTFKNTSINFEPINLQPEPFIERFNFPIKKVIIFRSA